MMYHRETEETFHVVCSCGQEYPLVKPDLIDQITCGVCGKIVKVTPDNLIRPTDTSTALFRRMKELPTSQRIQEGIRLIKEGKYELALPLLHSVIHDLQPMREAFYALGYCYHREKKYIESFIFLGIAVDLGHPHAKSLFEKTKSILGITEEIINPRKE